MNKIIIALDVPELRKAESLVTLLKDEVGAFKIGKQLFTRYGPRAVSMVHDLGSRVFLDLKFHDIPTTVSKAGLEVAGLGVFMFNIHAMGGFEMMKKTVDTLNKWADERQQQRPVILAVTVLTSMSDKDLKMLGISSGTGETVQRLAGLAMEAGVDGVVASPQETGILRQQCGKDFLIVTPGIRGATDQHHDQKRTMSPSEAIRAGADYIVVGRHVTESADPLETVKKINRDVENSM